MAGASRNPVRWFTRLGLSGATDQVSTAHPQAGPNGSMRRTPHMTRLVLVGPPGAGKGTQAATFSGRLGVPHISTGELFRQNVGEDTELGHQVKHYLDVGLLVPDALTEELVQDRLSEPDTTHGLPARRFPRTVNQAELLKTILAETDAALDAVIELRVNEDILVDRLLARGRAVDEVTDRVLAGLRDQRPHPVRTSATPGRHPLLPARPRP
jgi:adenylate kinase